MDNFPTFFASNRGLWQAENLEPYIVSEWPRKLYERNDKRIDISYANLDVLVKFFVVLYADETVVFATSEDDLISVMNTFNECWYYLKFDINYDKTKIIGFWDKIRWKETS